MAKKISTTLDAAKIRCVLARVLSGQRAHPRDVAPRDPPARRGPCRPMRLRQNPGCKIPPSITRYPEKRIDTKMRRSLRFWTDCLQSAATRQWSYLIVVGDTYKRMVDDSALDRVIDAYGGLALWRNLKCVVLQLDSLGGALPIAKGLGRTFACPSMVTVDPIHWRTEFHEFPQAGERAIFSRGAVQLIDRSGATTLDQTNYRESFRGLRKYRSWSPPDATYFFGYSLTTYLSIPFLLLGHATSVQTWKGGLRVEARLPQAIDTHSADQVFWFGRDGLLVRHDYRAEVVGWWAAGAHFTSAYHTVGGFPVATQRQVYARLFRAVTPVTVLSATMHPIAVKIA